MKGVGQWASGPESWGPNWDPLCKKKKQNLFLVNRKSPRHSVSLKIILEVFQNFNGKIPKLHPDFQKLRLLGRTSNSPLLDCTHLTFLSAQIVLSLPSTFRPAQNFLLFSIALFPRFISAVIYPRFSHKSSPRNTGARLTRKFGEDNKNNGESNIFHSTVV